MFSNLALLKPIANIVASCCIERKKSRRRSASLFLWSQLYSDSRVLRQKIPNGNFEAIAEIMELVLKCGQRAILCIRMLEYFRSWSWHPNKHHWALRCGLSKITFHTTRSIPYDPKSTKFQYVFSVSIFKIHRVWKKKMAWDDVTGSLLSKDFRTFYHSYTETSQTQRLTLRIV